MIVSNLRCFRPFYVFLRSLYRNTSVFNQIRTWIPTILKYRNLRMTASNKTNIFWHFLSYLTLWQCLIDWKNSTSYRSIESVFSELAILFISLHAQKFTYSQIKVKLFFVYSNSMSVADKEEGRANTGDVTITNIEETNKNRITWSANLLTS